MLFLVPSGKSDLMKTVKSLVPFCCRALGADFTAVSKVENSMLALSDYVIVEDREKEVVPPAVQKSGKACNLAWLKQCLIMGAALPPRMWSDK